MTKKITKAQALAALEEVVSGHEDYVYEYPEEILDCAYSTLDGQPSCIVGHVYAKLTPELFAQVHEYEWETWEEEGDAIQAFGAGELFDADYYEAGAMAVLRKAQANQDNGIEWGISLADAKSA